MEAEIGHIRRLLDLCRGKQLPVIYTTVVYTDAHLRDGGWFVRKLPALDVMRAGSTSLQRIASVNVCDVWGLLAAMAFRTRAFLEFRPVP